MATKISSPRPSTAWTVLAAVVAGAVAYLPAWYYNFQAVYGDHRAPVDTERSWVASPELPDGRPVETVALSLRQR